MLKQQNKLLNEENKLLKKEKENLITKLDSFISNDQQIVKIEEKYKILIDEKIKIIDDLKSILNRNVPESKNYNLLDGEKLIAINFKSVDNRINHSIICKNQTKFYEIENQLYKKYPEYAGSENCFMYNGKRINRSINLEDIGINGYIINFEKI